MSTAPLSEPTAAPPTVDPFGREMALSAVGLLADLNRTGVLTAADVHVARRLGRLGRCDDEQVLAAVGLAVRAVRHGAVCFDLGGIADLTAPALPAEAAVAAAEVGADDAAGVADVTAQWRERLLGSGLVRSAGADAVTPLVLDGDNLYLDRYWRQEGQVVQAVQERRHARPDPSAGLDDSLQTYFPAAEPVATGSGAGRPDDYRDQRAAAEAAARSWLTVVTGGPGTGKTTTIARLLGVLLDGDPELRIALAAPTGRAAARLSEAVRQATENPTFPRAHAARIAHLESRTLHRLLGWQPGRRTFRHNRHSRLPYDVVVVDETSMVSLTMMAQLLDAVRPQARLVLVGDADQLASVDAGAVLGDLVDGLGGVAATQVRELGPSRRFGPQIDGLAQAIRAGDADTVLALLASGAADPDGAPVGRMDREEVEPLALRYAVELRDAAARGDHAAALAALDAHRLLCAHREGPFGAGSWNRRIERGLTERHGRGWGAWYVGRPLIVTENDYGLGLFNGDVGVVVADEHSPSGMVAVIAAGERGHGKTLPVARLPEVRSAHAMTVHRSQGSQVDDVTVLLPEDTSRLLTRQLLYTAVTRAEQRVRVVGSEDAIRAAVGNDVPRASGLAQRLQGAG